MLRRFVVCALLLAIGFPSLLIRVQIPRPAPVCARHDCGCHGSTPSESCCCNPATDPTKVRWGCSPTGSTDTVERVREFSAIPAVRPLTFFDIADNIEITFVDACPGPRFAPPVPPPRTASSISA